MADRFGALPTLASRSAAVQAPREAVASARRMTDWARRRREVMGRSFSFADCYWRTGSPAEAKGPGREPGWEPGTEPGRAALTETFPGATTSACRVRLDCGLTTAMA